jgi:hypothetical protein
MKSSMWPRLKNIVMSVLVVALFINIGLGALGRPNLDSWLRDGKHIECREVDDLPSR